MELKVGTISRQGQYEQLDIMAAATGTQHAVRTALAAATAQPHAAAQTCCSEYPRHAQAPPES